MKSTFAISDAAETVAASTRPAPATVVVSEPDDERTYTTAEFAKIFNVTPSTVQKWETTGKISATRTFGNHRRFTHSEVIRFKLAVIDARMFPERYSDPTAEDAADKAGA